MTKRRMQSDLMPIELKKHLLGVFMASMYYNAGMTLQYLEQHGMTGSLIQEMLSIREKFTAEYERRFFIIGLSKMLMSQTLPAALQPQLLTLLNELVETITQLHDQVTKRVKQAADREAKLNSSDFSDDEEDDDDDDEASDVDEDDATNSSMPKKNATAGG